jgi:hypothetical protein
MMDTKLGTKRYFLRTGNSEGIFISGMDIE